MTKRRAVPFKLPFVNKSKSKYDGIIYVHVRHNGSMELWVILSLEIIV